MARKYARLKVLDHTDDWSDLTMPAQWLYLVLLRQPKLSVVGTLDVLPRRWVTAAGVTDDDVTDALAELEVCRYVVVDVKVVHDGAWWVVLDGQRVSDHATHAAARLAAIQHITPDTRRYADRDPA